MKLIWISVLLSASACFAANGPLLLQKPTVNKTHIVFAYAGDLWSVARAGGDAVRLTAGIGTETDPIFSPDGAQIAFQGEYDGNVDVYVMPAAGGEPKRLTYHPAPDTPVGWSADGKQVLFRSTRDSYSRFARLYTIPVEGGFPTPVDLPMAEYGTLLARWRAARLLTDRIRVCFLETLSRRRNDQDLAGHARGRTNRKSTSRKFERLQPDVGGRQSVFYLGPEWTIYSVRV